MTLYRLYRMYRGFGYGRALATSRVIGGQPDHWFVAAQPVPARLMLGQRVAA